MPKTIWVIIIFILALVWVLCLKESKANSTYQPAVLKVTVVITDS